LLLLDGLGDTEIYTPEQIAERGQELYERDIRGRVDQDPSNRGKMLAMDIESGEYELGDDSLAALDRLKAKRPKAPIYIVRVGFPTAVKLGRRRSMSYRSTGL
jgi:hypothetical protein